jgi:hypothetical protein
MEHLSTEDYRIVSLPSRSHHHVSRVRANIEHPDIEWRDSPIQTPKPTNGLVYLVCL